MKQRDSLTDEERKNILNYGVGEVHAAFMTRNARQIRKAVYDFDRVSGKLAFDSESHEEFLEIENTRNAVKGMADGFLAGLGSRRKFHQLADFLRAAPNSRLLSRKNGIFLIELLCPPANREGVIGDILEQYDNVREIQGEQRADIWFQTQIMWTALSLLGQRFRSLPGIALAALALSWIGRKLAGG